MPGRDRARCCKQGRLVHQQSVLSAEVRCPHRRRRLNLFRRPLDQLRPELHHDNPIDEAHHEIHVVLDQQDRQPLGAHLRGRHGVPAAMLRLDRAEERRLMHEADRQLQRIGMGELMHEQAGNLALGQQRLMEIARALAADPILLLLDEPAAGLRLKEKEGLADVMRQLRSEGLSILLVEHDMDLVMGLVDRVVVMEFGTKLIEGTPEEVQASPAVRAAYLGTEH